MVKRLALFIALLLAAPANAETTGFPGTAPWTIYASTLSCQSGAGFSLTPTGFSYNVIGKTVFVHGIIVVNTVGTCVNPTFSLPSGYPSAVIQAFGGRESAVTGKGIVAQLTAGGTVGIINLYDGTNPAVAGYNLSFVFAYESQ